MVATLLTSAASAASCRGPTVAVAIAARPLSSSIGQQQMTVAYNHMQRICPDAIRAYGKCVKQINDDPDSELVKDCCQKEFDAVNECFRRARKL